MKIQFLPACAASLIGLLVAGSPLAAQATDTLTSAGGPREAPVVGEASAAGEDRWFPPMSAFAPLLAAPLEVGLRGGFVVADRPAARDYEDANIEAEVAIGYRIPVVRLQAETPGRPALVLGFEVGVFSRFAMEEPEKDLIASDFRVGAPLSASLGPWAARLELRHVSSHLGDDFLRRFPREAPETTRDGLELLLARKMVPGLRLYAGGEYNFHVNVGVERAAGRFGIEWDPVPAPDGPAAWPFAATDFRVTDMTEGTAATATAGVGLRVAGTRIRLEARGHFGPTPLDQLRGTDEAFVGLGLRFEP